MTDGQYIAQQVLQAQQDVHAADAFIQQYMPFIRSETSKVIKRSAHEDEDALSIAMLAFYEAIGAYDSGKGGFLSFAARAIRNRLIDYFRQESRHRGLVFYHQTNDDGDGELLDTIADRQDHMEGLVLREAAQKEIGEFSVQLLDFGLSLTDIADNCPRQERTLAACMKVMAYARRYLKQFQDDRGHDACPRLLRCILRISDCP